jgi:hypothetical protein
MNYSKVWKQKITNDDGSIVITAQILVITSSSNNTVRQKIRIVLAPHRLVEDKVNLRTIN